MSSPKSSVSLTRPKRPLNPYLLFLQEQRAILQMQKPSLSHKELIKEVGILWNNLPPTDKKKYIEQYIPEITKYHEEVKDLKEKIQVKDENLVKRKRGRPRKPDNLPAILQSVMNKPVKKTKIEVKGTIYLDLQLTLLDDKP